MPSWKDVYSAKLLLMSSHALAQSKQRSARGKTKGDRRYTHRRVAGWQLGDGGRHLCMTDERWRGLQTVRCFLYLLYAFLICRVRGGWTAGGRVGGVRSEDGTQ